MGMLPSHIALLAKEQKKHPIKGDVLTLGQQSVYSSLDDVKNILQSQNVKLSALNDEVDVNSQTNKGSPLWDKRTSAQAVLSLMGAENVFVADCSEYENPDFLIDLNLPVGDEYFEKFDVILDIGTLEHVFNVPMLLRNLNFMLKKGGEMILINPTSNAIDHGFYSISPTLYFDYFGENNHANFSCYLCEEDPEMLFLDFPPKKVNIYEYDYVGDQFCFSSPHAVETVFFATKDTGSYSQEPQTPSQSLYSRKPGWNGEAGEKQVSNPKQVNSIFAKTKTFIKWVFLKSKPLLPSYVITLLYVKYFSWPRKKDQSENIIHVGTVHSTANIKAQDCRTTVRLKIRE